MSVKVTITEEELDYLSYHELVNIFENHESEFSQNHYYVERYNRKNQLIVMARTTDDTNIKPMIAMENQLVDTAAGYGLGKPVTYYDKSDDNYKVEKKLNLSYGIESEFVKILDEKDRNEYLEKLLNVYKQNDESSHNLALLRDCLITGSADEMVYTNENGEINIARVRDDAIAFYNTKIKPKMIGFARKIMYKDPITQNISYEYELYTNRKSLHFDANGVPSNIDFGGMNVNPIPFVRYDIGQSYIAKLIAEIRSYELVTENTKKILNYNDDAILIIRGYMFDQGKNENEIDKAVEEFKKKGVIFLDSEDDANAEWLSKNINDGANENHKKNLKDDIYTVAGTFNPANDNMVYQNTLSLMFKLYGLETKMVGYLMQFKKSFLKRCSMVTNLLNIKNSARYDSANIDITFTRNLPTNINEELNLINQAKDFLPLEELYKMVSFVDNPQKMVQKWKTWQIELAKLEIEKEKLRANATQSDIMPDRLNGSDNNED